jgi:hypothetical protein
MIYRNLPRRSPIHLESTATYYDDNTALLEGYMFRPIRELCPFANWTDQFANFDRFAN